MEAITRSAATERRTIHISSKRQITIPQRYYELLGFGTEAECILNGSELVIRPLPKQGEFAEEILKDLISQGYSGEVLLRRFQEEQRKIRPAVERMIAEADQLAQEGGPSPSFEELFGEED